MSQTQQDLITEKVRQLFASWNVDEAMEILDDYGSESYHVGKEWVQLAALKMCNGKSERLRNYMKTARGDYRDLLLLAIEPNQFRVEMASDFGASEEELELAERQDREQWESWLKGNDVRVCEKCSGLGIVTEGESAAGSTAVSGTTTLQWVECSFCKGTGNEI